jgi:hypothetical protein
LGVWRRAAPTAGRTHGTRSRRRRPGPHPRAAGRWAAPRDTTSGHRTRTRASGPAATGGWQPAKCPRPGAGIRAGPSGSAAHARRA